ncbi:hypothetical protein, partial [Azospirillum aestuarii]|uniref:hypothetical protein n=1 Tax=Azospirillum aestuarii TaxID=2802052 RepID=UPI0040552715
MNVKHAALKANRTRVWRRPQRGWAAGRTVRSSNRPGPDADGTGSQLPQTPEGNHTMRRTTLIAAAVLL